jgi:iron complex transport system substrate-binding protein
MKRIKQSFHYQLIIWLVIVVFFLLCVDSGQRKNQRIICLSPNYTEIIYELGMQNQIVGWTQYCNYPPEVQEVPGWVRYDEYEFRSVADELKKKIPVVSSFVDVNEDLIDSLKPTLILSSHEMQRKIAEKLRSKGYNVLHFEPVTLDDVFSMMEKIGEATGTLDRAKALTAQYRQEIQEIRAITDKLPRVSVYFEINHMGPYVLGSGSPMDQMIDIAGGKNIFEDMKGEAFRVDLEEIVKRNPDIILTPLWPAAGRDEVTTVYEIETRPGFNTIEAVLNDRVYHYDSSLLKRPGPRSVPAIKKLAYLFHPYYFKNPENSVDPWELGKIDDEYPPPKALK